MLDVFLGVMMGWQFLISYTIARTLTSKYHYDAWKVGFTSLAYGIGEYSRSRHFYANGITGQLGHFFRMSIWQCHRGKIVRPYVAQDEGEECG